MIKTQDPRRGMPTREVVAENLSRLLASNGMSAMDLARVADVSPATISLVRKGRNISIEKLETIAGAFGYRAWVLACPDFDSSIPQAQYDLILQAFTHPALDDNDRGSIIAFALYQSNS